MGGSTRVNSVQNEQKINLKENPHQVSLPDFCVYSIVNIADVCAFRNQEENEADEIQLWPAVVISMLNWGSMIRALLDTDSTSHFISENIFSLSEYGGGTLRYL